MTALEEVDVFKRIMAKYSDQIAPVYRPEDIRRNAQAGKISGMLTIEEGGCCKGSLGVLRRMYELGARMMTLTWNHENELASPNVVPGGGGDIWPCKPNTETGLKERGFEFLAEMERLHMIVDVSHLSDRGFWDVCGLTDRPFVATHSDSRALCRNSRNLTDEQFAEIAQRGGLVGINLYTPFLVRQSDSVLDDAIDHIERFIGMYGEKIVALGCDFDGCDQLPVGIEGLGDMYRLADRMLALGYREETVRGLFYDNAFAFIQKSNRVENLYI